MNVQPQTLPPAHLASAGWRVDLAAAPHLNTTTHLAFTVNLIAPQGSANGQDAWPLLDPDAEVPVSTRDAIDQMGELLWPWKWKGGKWRLWWRTDAATAWRVLNSEFDLEAGVEPVDVADAGDLQTALEAEIRGAATDCPNAFSIDEQWLGEPCDAGRLQKQSLVHALAPVTHSLALLSNDVFRMAGFLRVPKDGLPATRLEFIAFPRMTLGTARFQPRTPYAGKTFASYDSTLGESTQVVFSCDTAEVTTFNEEPVEPRSLGAGNAFPGGLDLVAGMTALPLRLIQTRLSTMYGWLGEAEGWWREWKSQPPGGQSPDQREQREELEPLLTPDWEAAFAQGLRRALLASLGAGWMRDYESVNEPGAHCLDFAQTSDDVAACRTLLPLPQGEKRYFRQLTPFNGDAAGAIQALAAWRTQIVPKSEPFDSWKSALQSLEKAVKRVDDAQNEIVVLERFANLREFAGAWLELCETLSGDRRAELFEPWIAARIFAVCDEAGDFQAVRTVLQDILKGEVVDRCLLGAIAGSTDSVWRQRIGAVEEATHEFSDDLDNEGLKKAEAAEMSACQSLARQGLQLAQKWTGDGLFLPPDGAANQLISETAEAVQSLLALSSRRNRSTPSDSGVALQFEDAAKFRTTSKFRANSQSVEKDQRIRGYAVLLQAGVVTGREENPIEPDKKNTAWITQCGVRRYDESPSSPGHRVKSAQPFAHGHGAIGSAIANDRRVTQFSYVAEPIVALREDEKGNLRVGSATDVDKIRSLDYRWYGDLENEGEQKPWNRPPLGLGLVYRGSVTELDNAGGVVAQALRSGNPRMPASVALASLLLDAVDEVDTWVPYRSFVPPGAPKLLSVQSEQMDGRPSRYGSRELEGESRTVVWVRQQLATIMAEGRAANHNADRIRDAQQAIVAAATIPAVHCLACGAKIKPANGKVNEGISLWSQDTPTELNLEFTVPDCATSFIREWLTTDLTVLRLSSNLTDLLSDEIFATHGKDALAKFMERFDSTMSQITPAHFAYHPAVSALGVEFDVWNAGGAPATISGNKNRCIVSRDRMKCDGQRFESNAQPLRLSVTPSDVASEPQATVTTLVDGKLVLPPGHFARVRVYALVDERFFLKQNFVPGQPTSSLVRFGKSARSDDRFADGKVKYCHFGPNEVWVEALPAWTLPTLRSLQVRTPGGDSGDTPQRYLGPAASQLWWDVEKLDADWLNRVRLQRHAWHWVGYLAEFPSLNERGQLDAWLPCFAGVESHREFVEVDLPSVVKEGAGWRIGDGVLQDQLQLHAYALRVGERPSTYAAYTLTPTLRFRRWLNPDLRGLKTGGPFDLERRILAAGNFVPGEGDFSEEARLPVPKLDFALPLTMTYAYAPDRGAARIPLNADRPGSLLVFDRALMRTDRFAKQGGIGETLEIDLVETRAITFSDGPITLRQIGLLSAQHGSPAIKTKVEAEAWRWELEVQPVHGLTFDLSRNAKVTQTAAVVVPRRMAPGDASRTVPERETTWVLAQVRSRRVIAPETQLNTLRPPVSPAGKAPSWLIHWRRVGKHRVPRDFSVDVSDLSPGTITLTLSALIAAEGARNYLLSVPLDRILLPESKAIRLLVSFHQGRWRGADMTWAAQVLVQVRVTSDRLGWKTIATRPCSDFGPWVHHDGTLALRVEAGHGKVDAVHHVALSDYGEPRWLLFIGRMQGTSSTRPDEYRLEQDQDSDGRLIVRVTSGSFGALAPPPTTPGDWGQDRINFYLLFVCAPLGDVLAGEGAAAAAFDVLVFRPTKVESATAITEKFELMQDTWPNEDGSNPINPRMLDGCTATLVGFHQVNVPTAKERSLSATDFATIVSWIFPPQGERATEALFRPNGQVWGEMRIVSRAPTR